MPGIDETRQFVPLKIAVLTVSDTRELADDKSGNTLVERIRAAGHVLAERAIVKDDVKAIRQRVKAWIADKFIDVVITTGGTGFTGRDVTPEAVEPLFEKNMDGFATMFLLVSEKKIGTSAIQTRATAGVANATYIFCLPGSPGACKDAWDEILVHQLDYRYRPCNFVEILPRLDEHLRRRQGERRLLQGVTTAPNPKILADHRPCPSSCASRCGQREAGLFVDMARGGENAVRPQRDFLVAGRAREADAFVDQPRAEPQARAPSGRPAAGGGGRRRVCPSPA